MSLQVRPRHTRSELDLLRADACVSVTGVGGPEPSEGEPAGTVWMAVATKDDVVSRKVHLDGDPAEVVEKTVDVALEMLLEVLRG